MLDTSQVTAGEPCPLSDAWAERGYVVCVVPDDWRASLVSARVELDPRIIHVLDHHGEFRYPRHVRIWQDEL
jgi:hypothetical protein